MDILTLKDIARIAPGAARRANATKDHLLCTHAFLEGVSAQYKPVFAMQGTTHGDSSTVPRDGRHLVVASRPDGVALALLNSHCKLLRVWIGMGLWNGEDLLLNPSLCLPVQRWRGVDKQLEKFVNEKAIETVLDVKTRRDADTRAVPNFLSKLCGHVSRHGYISGRGKPSPAALLNVADLWLPNSGMLAAAFAVVKSVRQGNIPVSGAGRRNVKGIRRPDAYWHLAKSAYEGRLKASTA